MVPQGTVCHSSLRFGAAVPRPGTMVSLSLYIHILIYIYIYICYFTYRLCCEMCLLPVLKANEALVEGSAEFVQDVG